MLCYVIGFWTGVNGSSWSSVFLYLYIAGLVLGWDISPGTSTISVKRIQILIINFASSLCTSNVFQARSEPAQKLRPAYFSINGVVYFIQVMVQIWLSPLQSKYNGNGTFSYSSHHDVYRFASGFTCLQAKLPLALEWLNSSLQVISIYIVLVFDTIHILKDTMCFFPCSIVVWDCKLCFNVVLQLYHSVLLLDFCCMVEGIHVLSSLSFKWIHSCYTHINTNMFMMM